MVPKILAISLLFMTSCGQVEEDEVSLNQLADGQTSTKYVDASGNEVNVVLGENGAPTIVDENGDPIVEEVEEVVVDDSLTGLAAASAEIFAESDCSSNCTFSENFQVTSAIVVWADDYEATADCGSGDSNVCSLFVVTDNGQTGGYLNFFNETGDTIQEEVVIGDVISFKVNKFSKGFFIEINGITDLVVDSTEASISQFFTIANNATDLGTVDFDNLETAPEKIYSGYFKISGAIDSGNFPITTASSTSTELVFRPSNSGDYTVGNCYQLKNVWLAHRFGSYQISESDFAPMSSVSEVTCGDVGL